MLENIRKIDSKMKTSKNKIIINKAKNRTRLEFKEKMVFITIKDISNKSASFLKKLDIFEEK